MTQVIWFEVMVMMLLMMDIVQLICPYRINLIYLCARYSKFNLAWYQIFHVHVLVSHGVFGTGLCSLDVEKGLVRVGMRIFVESTMRCSRGSSALPAWAFI